MDAAYVEAVGQMLLCDMMENMDEVGDNPIDSYPSVCEGGGYLYYHFDKIAEDVLKDRSGIRRLRDLGDRVYENISGCIIEPGKDSMVSFNPPKNVDIESFYESVLNCVLETGVIVRDKHGKWRQKEFNVEPKGAPTDFIEVTHSRSAVDMTRGGVTKGKGILEALKVSGTNPRDVLVIGDAWNDRPGMEVVGHIGIVGSAKDDFKKWGKEKGAVIATKPHIYGVEEIIEQFI